jgi:hypothetical protein
MASKNAVVKIDEVKDDNKRITRLETITRLIMKAMEIHWGIDLNKDGKIGNVRVAMLCVIALGGIIAFAADTTIFGLRPSGQEPLADFNATSDGTDVTLTVNKIVANTSITLTNTTIGGTLTVNGTGKIAAATVAASGAVTGSVFVATAAGSTFSNVTVNGTVTLGGAGLVTAGTLTNGPMITWPATGQTNNFAYFRMISGTSHYAVVGMQIAAP